MKVGLFFGSFNPIHIGHLIIANTIVELGALQQVWFIVTPQNPFKKRKSLAHEFDRYDMVQLAIGDNHNLHVSDVEFHLPKPSYTATTLTVLSEKYPNHTFRLIMGSDNLQHLHKWRNYQYILDNFGVIVYPRPNVSFELVKESPLFPYVEVVDAPLMEISATLIRRLIQEEKSIQYLVPDEVANYIRTKKLYQ